MSELSNALRQRLACGGEPRVHPDSDTLTAYLEQLLPAVERNQVLEHLAVCRECRDVTALSLPEQPVVADRPAAMTLPARRGWRAWLSWKPALGLAASLAGLAIVTTMIVELPRGSVGSEQKQAGQQSPVASASNNAPAARPLQPESVAAQPRSIPANPIPHEAPSRADLASAKPPGVTSVRTAGTITGKPAPKTAEAIVVGSYVNSLMFASDGGNAVPQVAELPSAPVPSMLVDHPPNRVVLNNGTQLTFGDAPHQAQSSRPLRILSPSANAGRFGLSMVTTLGHDAKQLFRRPAPPINAYGFASSAMGGVGQFNPAKGLGAFPEITAAAPLMGGDAASLDQSHAFTARALADANPGKIEAGMVEDRAKKAAGALALWKVTDGKLLKMGDSGAWTEVYSAGEGIQFSVVRSRGSDVWAGGSNAALVHSRDGGVTWERITLGASAAGTITGIESSGSNVLVKSSSGQSWSSLDGGKTWTLED